MMAASTAHRPCELKPNSVEFEVLVLCNEFRAEQQLAPLRWHSDLAGIAKRHADAVAEGRAPFSHVGAKERFACCATRCINVAENLARSEGFGREDLPQAAVTGWVESEGHRRNLLGPFDACGIGWAASDAGVIFMTQLLALVDEGSSFRSTVRTSAYGAATSTPVILAAVGFIAVGPATAVGCGLVGGAVDRKYGVKACKLPHVARKRITGLLCHRFCAGCGAPGSGELLLNDGDGRLFCGDCHPTPSDHDVWCFVE